MAGTLAHMLPGGARGLADYRARHALAAGDHHDPHDSGMWPDHRRDLLGVTGDDWANDARLLIMAAPDAEDASHVPVMIDATEVEAQVEQLVVTIDYSPLPKVLVFHPGRLLPVLGFGVKYEIGSPIRVSARLAGGGWRMASAFVDAAGGGCTVPAAAHARPGWQDDLGQMRARLWPVFGRLKLWLRHPMDTGLADGIAAHHLTEIRLSDAGGEVLARIELFEPVEEDPCLTFALPGDLAQGPVLITARDNLGYRFTGRVEP